MNNDVIKLIDSYIDGFKSVELNLLEDSASFIKSSVYNCKLNSGDVIKREKIMKGGKDGSAAIIVPITCDNKTVLVVEPRVFTKKTVGVGFPAGYIENGEKPTIAALRELSEEIGYIPKRIIPLTSFYQDSGCSSAYNHVFLAIGCEKVMEQHLDDSEFIKYVECDFEMVEQLIDKKYIEGCNSLIAYEYVKRYIERR